LSTGGWLPSAAAILSCRCRGRHHQFPSLQEPRAAVDLLHVCAVIFGHEGEWAPASSRTQHFYRLQPTKLAPGWPQDSSARCSSAPDPQDIIIVYMCAISAWLKSQ
jgi:hypothetical protein